MSGHSKWSTIKRKKSAVDAKRGKLFTKLAREIQIAAREGADPEFNIKLRLALEKAKAANMPKDNIERAIRRGAGLEKGEALEEIVYEGYAPNGVALMIYVVTDNRNRAVADVRRILTRSGGNLGENGSVAWQFDEKGYIVAPLGGMSPDDMLEIVLEAGADDFEIDGDVAEIYTDPKDLNEVKNFLESKGVKIEQAELAMIPKNYVSLPLKETLQVMSVIEKLEELDDVSKVYSNLEVTEEAVAAQEEG